MKQYGLWEMPPTQERKYLALGDTLFGNQTGSPILRKHLVYSQPALDPTFEHHQPSHSDMGLYRQARPARVQERQSCPHQVYLLFSTPRGPSPSFNPIEDQPRGASSTQAFNPHQNDDKRRTNRAMPTARADHAHSVPISNVLGSDIQAEADQSATDIAPEMKALFEKMDKLRAKDPAMFQTLLLRKLFGEVGNSTGRSSSDVRSPLSGSSQAGVQESVSQHGVTASAPGPSNAAGQFPRPQAITSATVAPGEDESAKRLRLAAAKTILEDVKGVRENNAVDITIDEIYSMLEDNPPFPVCCDRLEKRGLKFHRGHLARRLLATVPSISRSNRPRPTSVSLRAPETAPPPTATTPTTSVPADDHAVRDEEVGSTIAAAPISAPTATASSSSGPVKSGVPKHVDGKKAPSTPARHSPAPKAKSSRKRGFSELVGAMHLNDDDDHVVLNQDVHIEKAPRLESTPAQKQALPQPSQGQEKKAILAQPIKIADAVMYRWYDPKTVASDILIAAGRHPHERALNAHMAPLLDKYINLDSDLSTLDWDAIDPGGPPIPEVSLKTKYHDNGDATTTTTTTMTSPLPNPSHPIFKCRWKSCGVELHNLPTLRRHISNLHRPSSPEEIAEYGFACWWKHCRFLQRDGEGSFVTTHTFATAEAWLQHIVADHLSPVALKWGDGPNSHTLMQDKTRYLCDAHGASVTPSVSRRRNPDLPPDPIVVTKPFSDKALGAAQKAFIKLHRPTERLGTKTTAEEVLRAMQARKARIGPGLERGGCTLVNDARRDTFVQNPGVRRVVDAGY
ncbi:hypothetical protein DV735_g1380, partial [Chaetothyriales sp. CBS 134920]